MAFNSGFPMNYQPMYQPMAYPQQPTVPNQQQGNLIWVSGEAGAKAYLVAPNTTVQLWDSERQVIYLKSADASGMPSMKILDYTIRDRLQTELPVQTQSNEEFVTRKEFDALKAQIEEREARRSEHHANADAVKE